MEQNTSTNKYFFKRNFLSAGDPLSVHIRTCAVLIVNRRLSRALYCIFCPQKTKYPLLNFYKLIPYPMDNCFTGRRNRSRQTPEKDVLYRIPAGLVRRVHSPGGASYFLFLSRHRDVIASFSCLVLVRPLVS